jgi:hypothetical protein
VDFEMKVGIGLARFGNLAAGKRHLASAVKHAEEYNLNDCLFRAEDALEKMTTSSALYEASTEWREEADAPDVARVAHELQLIRTAG